jgi:hypothetical protein
MDESFIYSLFVGKRASVGFQTSVGGALWCKFWVPEGLLSLELGLLALACASYYDCGVLYSSRWL